MYRKDGSILAELDMLFSPEQWAQLQELRSDKRLNKRNALRSLQKRWTNAVVPYVLTGSFSENDKKKIQEGINEWNKYSCVNIRPRTSSDKYFVRIVDRGGCSSYVGMWPTTQGQQLTLSRGCRYKRIVAHEFGHALGFHHEQTRPDRDEYVRILTENVSPGMAYNFRKYDWRKINSYDVPYDYESVMHYGRYAFSHNGKETIQTIDPKYQSMIGRAYGVSFSDIKLLNLMYDCNKKCPKKTCPGAGFVGKDCRCWCKGRPAIYCDSKEPVGDGDSVGPKPTQPPKPTQKPKPTQPPTTGDEDSNPDCPGWAARGDCKTNPETLFKICKKSCKEASNSVIKDLDANCPAWAKIGECKRSPGYMLIYCKLSCKRVGAM